VTVTVNALAPSLLSRLCNGVLDRGRYVRGLKGAELLIDAQMAGVQTAARSGLTVKVNSVLVPGVNEHHIRDIARAAARLGASLMNVIPLIPQAELASVPAPDCALVDRVRREVERFLPAFRHCRRCRADACGIPGGIDHGTELYGHDSPASGGETFAHG
jgi:nitrogen fixation protein NifB